MSDPEHLDYIPPTVAELHSVSRERIAELYLRAARSANHTVASFYLDELQRRDARKRELLMIVLTAVIAVLTAASLWAVLHASDTETDGHHRHGHDRHETMRSS